MKFNIYDILSKIIPGGIVYLVLYLFHKEKMDDISEVLALIVMYVLGYLIETIASVSERKILFKSFGGNPAKKLLEGNNYFQIKINIIDEINKLVKEKFPNIIDDKMKIFHSMYSQVGKGDFIRINEFLQSYVFSRNLLTSMIFAMVYYLVFRFSIVTTIIFIILLIIVWIRTKQRNYYFVKEVIQTYYEVEIHELGSKNSN